MDPIELFLYQQTQGVGGMGSQGWFAIALFLVLCFACLVKQDNIHSPGLYRYSIILFVLSMVAPFVVAIFFNFMELSPSTNYRSMDSTTK